MKASETLAKRSGTEPVDKRAVVFGRLKPRQRRFLEKWTEAPSFAEACRMARIPETTVRHWFAKADFMEAYYLIGELAVPEIELAHINLAKSGNFRAQANILAHRHPVYREETAVVVREEGGEKAGVVQAKVPSITEVVKLLLASRTKVVVKRETVEIESGAEPEGRVEKPVSGDDTPR